MPLYLIIEEWDADDELMSYHKYDITEPPDHCLIPLPDGTAFELRWCDDLPTYHRRAPHPAPALKPCAVIDR